MKQLCTIPSELNFTFSEFFRSAYAIQLDVNNVTSDPKILTTIMTTICCLLQPIRTLCNMFDIVTPDNDLNPYKNYELKKLDKPTNVGLNLTGGWRSKELIKKCKTILGVVMAETGHPDGECADLNRSSWTNLKLFCVIKALHKAGYIEFDQLIYEYDTNCCHVGYRGKKNRNQILIRKVVNNKIMYYNV